ncbi:hypothetical protein SDJN03_01587, partial [Cucurbita argyrosperma subsp. sororia]
MVTGRSIASGLRSLKMALDAINQIHFEGSIEVNLEQSIAKRFFYLRENFCEASKEKLPRLQLWPTPK